MIKHYNHDAFLNWAASVFASKSFDAELIQSTSYSYVFRLNAQEEVYYLKSCPPALYNECYILERIRSYTKLASVPELIAKNDGLYCFITKKCGDFTLRETFENEFDSELLLKGFRAYQNIQLKSSKDVSEYLNLGANDWRLDKFTKVYAGLICDPVFQEYWDISSKMTEMLEVQYDTVQRLCDELARLEIPDVLNNSDLNDNNMVVDEPTDDICIIDWGETNISHPFLSFSSSLYGIAGRYNISSSDEVYDQLILEYLSSWGVKSEDIEDVLRISNVLGQLYYVFTMHDMAMRAERSFPNLVGRVHFALEKFLQSVESHS